MNDLPAWLQAFAAIMALAIATWTVRETKAAADKALREARADKERRDELRACVVAASIILDLTSLHGNVSRVVDALFNSDRPIQRVRNFNGNMSLEATDEALIKAVNVPSIEVPQMLTNNLGRLHWLGNPAGPALLVIMSMVFLANVKLERFKKDVSLQGSRNLAGWLNELKSDLDLILASLQQVQLKVESLISGSDDVTNQPRAPWWTRPPR